MIHFKAKQVEQLAGYLQLRLIGWNHDTGKPAVRWDAIAKLMNTKDMSYVVNLFQNKQQNSTIETKDHNMKTTSSLLELAADNVIESLALSRGVSHVDVEPAILIAAQHHGYRKNVISKAMTIAKLFLHDADGFAVDLGKLYTSSRDPYAYQSVERNAFKRADALLLAAEIAKSPIRKPFKLPTMDVNKTTSIARTTKARLVKAQNKLAVSNGHKANIVLSTKDNSLAKNIAL